MRNLNSAERTEYVITRRADRASFRQIGAELGISAQRVHTIWSKALRELPAQKLAELRTEEGQLADTAISELLGIARDPMTSPRSRIEAWGHIRAWSDSR